MQADIDLGKLLAQPGHEFGQYVAGLGVCGGDGQRAAVLLAELFSNPPQVADFAQDQIDAFEYVLAGLGDPLESLSVPGKNFDAQFAFELQNGFGNAGLRGVERLCRLGQVQIASYGFLHKAELMEVHN